MVYIVIESAEWACCVSFCLCILRSHGDMLYLSITNSGVASENDASSCQFVLEEDEVDKELAKVDGRVYRNRDTQL